MFFGFCFIDRGFMTASEFRLLNVLPRTGWLSGVFWQQRLPDCVSAYPFFFLRRKKNLKKKELQGGYPLDPHLRWRHHNRMGYQREDGVQVAQRGQVKARTVKHPAANFPWLPLRGEAKVCEDCGWHNFPREFRGTTERRRCGIIPVPRSSVS